MHSTKLKFLPVFVLMGFCGCVGNDVPRPNTTFCEVDVPKLELICYNLASDYDNDGNLLPNAKPVITYYPNEHALLMALNKSIGTDPQGFANIKAYIRNLRAANGQE